MKEKNNKKKTIVIIFIGLCVVIILSLFFLLFRNYLDRNIEDTKKEENVNIEESNESENFEQIEKQVIDSTKEGTFEKSGSFTYFKSTSVNGKDINTVMYNGYIFKYPYKEVNMYFYPDKNYILMSSVSNDENKWNSKVVFRDGTYQSRLSKFDELNSNITNAGYKLISSAKEVKIGDKNHIVIEYSQDGGNNLAVYGEYYGNTVGYIIEYVDGANCDEIIKKIDMAMDMSYKQPEYESIKLNDYTVSYNIAKDYVKTFGMGYKDHYTWTYSKIKNGFSTPSIDVSITLKDYSDFGNYNSKYSSVDNVINEKYDSFKSQIKSGKIINANLEDIKEYEVNGKVAKYFKCTYSYEFYDGVKEQEDIYFVYPVDTDKNMFLIIEADTTSHYDIDFNEVEVFFKGIKQ